MVRKRAAARIPVRYRCVRYHVIQQQWRRYGTKTSDRVSCEPFFYTSELRTAASASTLVSECGCRWGTSRASQLTLVHERNHGQARRFFETCPRVPTVFYTDTAALSCHVGIRRACITAASGIIIIKKYTYVYC